MRYSMSLFVFLIEKGVKHIWRPLWRGGEGVGVRQKLDVIGRRGRGVSECSERPIFIFLLKKI